MELSPSISAEALQLHQHRETRARVLGIRISIVALVLASIGALIEWFFGCRYMAMGNVTMATGALLSWQFTIRKGRDSKFVLPPLMVAYWFGGGLNIFRTGGLASPYLVIYIVALFLIGVLLQTRFGRGKVAIGCLIWLGAGAMIQYLGLGEITVSEPGSIFMQLFRYVVLAAAFFFLIEQLFRSEEIFVKASENQARLLRRAHFDMAHAEKLAQVGKLVATTAHEFAQPVQVITMCSSMLRRGLQESGEVDPEKVPGLRQFVMNIQDASARLGRLLNQLREFSRKDQFMAKPFDCREAIQSVETMVRHDLEHRNVQFLIRMPKHPIIVSGDVMNVQQVLFNLIGNGRDAAVRSEKPRVEVRLEQFKQWARIRVSNSGPPIPLSDQARIFEPYFTTKRRGEGTGLGLPVCQDLVQLNRGRIFFCSQEDATDFVVDLPRVV